MSPRIDRASSTFRLVASRSGSIARGCSFFRSAGSLTGASQRYAPSGSLRKIVEEVREGGGVVDVLAVEDCPAEAQFPAAKQRVFALKL